MTNQAEPLELLATAAFGVEATVKWELSRLGYEAKGSTPGRLAFTGDATAIVRTNLHLRAADRVLLVMGRFSSVDFDELYAGIASLDWKSRIPAGAKITVRVGVVRSDISSARSAQSIVKRAIVDTLAGKGGSLDETGEEIVVDVSILNNEGDRLPRHERRGPAQTRLPPALAGGAAQGNARSGAGHDLQMAQGPAADRPVLRQRHDRHRSRDARK